MVLIKQYRIEGVGHTGAPYTMDKEFNEAQAGARCYFDPVHGIPLNVAEYLVNGWNRTVKMYGKPTVYSIIMPPQELPDEPQSASTVNVSIEDATMDDAFDCVKDGTWTAVHFEEWVLRVTAEASHDGYNDGIAEAKAMIDSLLKE